MFLWRVASDILPTMEKLTRFFPAMDPKCPLCDASPGSSLHLFVYCHAARFLWAGNEWGCRPDAMQFDCQEQQDISNRVTVVEFQINSNMPSKDRP
ncbi:hypothetical protein CFP56_017586 [Quercus suber]|uniref:Reverse transcriptase zinc-binding domain-containing protein n=1 Tax=Quercus suber TaxID=58331 RepID=A0AAW0KKK6_QUESU